MILFISSFTAVDAAEEIEAKYRIEEINFGCQRGFSPKNHLYSLGIMRLLIPLLITVGMSGATISDSPPPIFSTKERIQKPVKIINKGVNPLEFHHRGLVEADMLSFKKAQLKISDLLKSIGLLKACYEDMLGHPPNFRGYYFEDPISVCGKRYKTAKNDNWFSDDEMSEYVYNGIKKLEYTRSVLITFLEQFKKNGRGHQNGYSNYVNSIKERILKLTGIVKMLTFWHNELYAKFEREVTDVNIRKSTELVFKKLNNQIYVNQLLSSELYGKKQNDEMNLRSKLFLLERQFDTLKNSIKLVKREIAKEYERKEVQAKKELLREVAKQCDLIRIEFEKKQIAYDRKSFNCYDPSDLFDQVFGDSAIEEKLEFFDKRITLVKKSTDYFQKEMQIFDLIERIEYLMKLYFSPTSIKK